ncbi:MAG: NADH-quinone oxidoreductase subunit A [Acidimicrobiia bacterium]|nr:NADH-quinone oxidoreductase subunit A [Acidimicrobiia bacterium]MDH5519279.1 NADH-quinone oxidoreductase subunit A [Acidimicrobiia bacterium]
MAQYLPVLALLILAALFAGLSIVASKLLAPRNPTVEKLAPYECGIIPGREPPERFPVRFYLVAMLFVIFDIEIVFLYPWAIASGRLGLAGFLAILIFSALLFESFVYLISKGALDWGPLQVNRMQVDRDIMRSAGRTSESTIRRVGFEGRYENAEEFGAAMSPRGGDLGLPGDPASDEDRRDHHEEVSV